MPAGELRRRDREMGAAESEGLLDRALVGRIATSSTDGAPYVVPMNFAYNPELKTVFLHCADSGHLLSNLAVNPRACFEVDEPAELIATGPAACDTSHAYSSVICFGRTRILSDYSAKERALRLLVEKYVDGLMPGRVYEPELQTIDTTTVIALEVETMTGKRRSPA